MRPTGLYDDGCSLAVKEKIDQERMWRSNICVFLLLVAPLLAYRTLPLSGFVFPHVSTIDSYFNSLLYFLCLSFYQSLSLTPKSLTLLLFQVRANTRDKLSASITQEQAGFSQSFITQKNVILLDKLLNPINGNITEMASQYVNFCDESFDVFLNERIATIDDEEGKKVYGNIRYEINSARQRKLIGFIQSLSTRSLPRVLTLSFITTEADKILRGILAAGELKKMEAKLQYHLRRAEIDMPFMVILQLNIEDAIMSNVTIAVQVMKHLETLINEHQDSLVSPPVRLMRLLVLTHSLTYLLTYSLTHSV